MNLTATDSGLQFEDTTVGDGALAAAGQRVSVHYTGWLFEGGVAGTRFDTSLDRGQPFQFQGKYPPAKPGALGCEPLKAAMRGR